MLTYEGNDKTALDIAKEFEMRLADDYLNWAREEREKHLNK